MTDPAVGVSGAKLDELAAITGEYGRRGGDVVGSTVVALAAWIVAAELVYRVDPRFGSLVFAAGAPLVLAIIPFADRRAFPHGLVRTPPDPLLETGQRGVKGWSFPAALAIVNLLVLGPVFGRAGALSTGRLQAGSGMVSVLLAFAVTVNLVGLPARAARHVRGPQRSNILLLAVFLPLLRDAVGRGSEEGIVSVGIISVGVLSVAGLLAVGGVAIALGERRAIRALEARLAFLQEHAR